MTPYLAFLLGLLVAALIILPFWILSARFPQVSDGYLNVFCKQAITYPLI